MVRGCRSPDADSNSRIACRRNPACRTPGRACRTGMRLGAVAESGRAPEPRFPSMMRRPRHRAGSVSANSPTTPSVRRVAALKLETTRPRMTCFFDMEAGIGSALGDELAFANGEAMKMGLLRNSKPHSAPVNESGTLVQVLSHFTFKFTN